MQIHKAGRRLNVGYVANPHLVGRSQDHILHQVRELVEPTGAPGCPHRPLATVHFQMVPVEYVKQLVATYRARIYLVDLVP